MESLKRYCEHYNESYSACLVLLGHLINTGWKEQDAIEHIEELIAGGVFDEIRALIGVEKRWNVASVEEE